MSQRGSRPMIVSLRSSGTRTSDCRGLFTTSSAAVVRRRLVAVFSASCFNFTGRVFSSTTACASADGVAGAALGALVDGGAFAFGGAFGGAAFGVDGFGSVTWATLARAAD